MVTIDTVTAPELLKLRMRALGLAGEARNGAGESTAAASGTGGIEAAARRMLAVQGQDWRSSRWALGLRAPGTTLADVRAAFDSGGVVRSWPMRGTIHVVSAEDIGWMQNATNRKVLAGAAKRREFLGIDDATLDRLVEISLAALSGLAARGTGLDRDALAAVWTEAGIDWRSNWRYHLIWWMCQNGLTTFGPLPAEGGGEPLLVRADEWIRARRDLTGDEALAELAARYAAARGPIRERDLAWWTGLGVREARLGLEIAAEEGRLQRLQLAETEATARPGRPGALWAAPELLGGELSTAAGAVGASWLLLPAFDEHLLGYTDREAQLDPEHFELIVPGRNGMFKATVVANGRVVGTWKRSTRKSGGLEVTAMPGCGLDTEALQPAVADWSRFHGFDAPVPLAEGSQSAPSRR